MSDLLQRQFKFSKLVGLLLVKAYTLGYTITVGEMFRTPEQAALNAKAGIGIKNSLHTKRLAVDLNVFKDGVYLDQGSKFKNLGDYWKTLDPDCTWGGDFTSLPDGNHFSLSFNGVK